MGNALRRGHAFVVQAIVRAPTVAGGMRGCDSKQGPRRPCCRHHAVRFGEPVAGAGVVMEGHGAARVADRLLERRNSRVRFHARSAACLL